MESTRIHINNTTTFKEKALHWASFFAYCCVLDSNDDQQYQYSQFDWMLGADAKRLLSANENSLTQLQAFIEQSDNTVFGHFGYELKNELEALDSKHPSFFDQEHLSFFEARYVMRLEGHYLTVNRNYVEAMSLIDHIMNFPDIPLWEPKKAISFKADFGSAEYIEKVQAIRQHIKRGDVYEMNLCQVFEATEIDIKAPALYHALNQQSKAPFACYYKREKQHVLCASPERYLAKRKQQLISQPIKGTSKRGTTPEEDQVQLHDLEHSVKERAENVMITDLVRNDLHRVCTPGSVEVPELIKPYSFPNVHQLISTITGTLKDDLKVTDAIAASFPMGSMTGAPKVNCMELIERYETRQRGVYSGAIGYIEPNGDFDFNVVIRSLFYDQNHKRLAFQVGGAITYDSIPEMEYEECLTKAAGMLRACRGQLTE